ncbi:hypothetical protein B0H17DRAFT_1182298 [Mycena rosella]|uniref:F-box domain-containing protein n=1 Tax=Mycena rosella TaxID=1033263 RepID=A0AAD7D8A8_MYCRO|nr:hypothetical protein B0H17DRAFT_1182298 [Mycena rosella]
MSVADLQARIETVSGEIDRQKEVLKKLERSKSALQRQLNAVRDPVTRLPLEISSEIFIQCLPSSSNPQPGARDIPMLFLNICNAWTDIALSNLALWEAIHIKYPRAKGFGQLLAIWLSRARNHSLSLSIHGTLGEGDATIVREYAEKLRSLKIHSHDDDYLDLLERMSFPSLKTLEIGILRDAYGEAPCYSLYQTLDILRVAPNLVECTFYNLSTCNDSRTGNLLLPSLRFLAFRGEFQFSDDEILKLLTLPALETLALTMVTVSLNDLASFLKRSSPLLQNLIMIRRYTYQELDFTQLDECLRLVPTLTHLELSGRGEYPAPMFTSLADSPSLLPNLLSIQINCPQQTITHLLYSALVRALSARRTQIICCKINWEDGTEPAFAEEPHAHIREALRGFAADGMQIQLGSRSRNYLYSFSHTLRSSVILN